MGSALQMPRSALVKRSSAPVLLVQGLRDASGELAWYFVQVSTAKLAMFQRQLSTGKVDFRDYGTVLASGYGEAPPAAVKQRMTDVYGFKE